MAKKIRIPYGNDLPISFKLAAKNLDGTITPINTSDVQNLVVKFGSNNPSQAMQIDYTSDENFIYIFLDSTILKRGATYSFYISGYRNGLDFSLNFVNVIEVVTDNYDANYLDFVIDMNNVEYGGFFIGLKNYDETIRPYIEDAEKATEKANASSLNANRSAEKAQEAAEKAQFAKDAAEAATHAASDGAANANLKATLADTAAQAANSSAQEAQAAKTAADAATMSAQNAAAHAEEAASTIDSKIGDLQSEITELESEICGINVSNSIEISKTGEKLILDNLYIRANKQFKFKVSSEDAEWTRLMLYGNSDNYPNSDFVFDNIENGVEYTKVINVDITKIYIFPVNVTTFGTFKIELSTNGKIDVLGGEIESKYTKPNGGIPKADLDSSVTTILSKADDAIVVTSEKVYPINLLDTDSITLNKFLNPDSGNITFDTIDYSVTDYIHCTPAKKYNTNGSGSYMYYTRYVCFYDASKNYLGSSTYIDNPKVWTAPSGASFMRCMLDNTILKDAYLQIVEGEVALPYSEYFEPYYVNIKKINDEYLSSVRKTIKINVSDSEQVVFNKMYQAYQSGNYDVIFERGTYTFAEIYAYMRDTLGWSWLMEIPIGNGCRYYLNGSTLISNAPSGEYNDSRNLLGCKAYASDFELHDGILINNGGTYCVHDECGNGGTIYTHRYVNMQMYYKGTPSDGYGKCIGGGMGINGFVEITNCTFFTEYDNQLVTWHALLDGNNAKMQYFINDSYFGGQVRIDGGESDDIFVKFTNNGYTTQQHISANNTVVAFNNNQLV